MEIVKGLTEAEETQARRNKGEKAFLQTVTRQMQKPEAA